MATPFRVDLLTPERSVFAGEADEVSMRTEIGEITFLAQHEDFIGAADSTVVRIHATSSAGSDSDGSFVRVAVHGGIVHVDHDGLVLLASVAELGSDIDVERARRALERAEERLSSEGESRERDGEDERAAGSRRADAPESAARRARTRLEAAGADAAA